MFEPKNFEHLIGAVGFSEALLKNHFALYQGYVKNTNIILEKLKSLPKDSAEFAELKRRLGWEFNGMRLHELYFGNMKKDSSTLAKDSKLFKKISEEFGSFEEWEKDFRAVGSMRGIGWAILFFDKNSGRLFNAWTSEHDVGIFAGALPLLVMDVFEHAYMLDYGIKKSDYISAFFLAIDWDSVGRRLE